MADFVVGPLKLRLQFIHPFLTLLQLTLETQHTLDYTQVTKVDKHIFVLYYSHCIAIETVFV